MLTDHWIYIHDPSVKVGRIQNYRVWSPDMTPDPAVFSLGLEYFCFAGDGIWMSDDSALIALATRELAQVGLADASQVVDGLVIRQPNAYPVYDEHYAPMSARCATNSRRVIRACTLSAATECTNTITRITR